MVGPPGFEPESVTPEATRIPSYPTAPIGYRMEIAW